MSTSVEMRDPMRFDLARNRSSISRHDFQLLNEFAIGLYDIQSESELAWKIARDVVGRMGFQDCVFYYADREARVLRQAAAIGAKNPKQHLILNPLVIPFGDGITGHVAETRKPEIVADLSTDERYIPDLEPALSEICVPILVEDTVWGVIDCEDRRANYFTDIDLLILTTVAAMAAGRLTALHKESNLRNSRARFDEIIEMAPEAIVLLSADMNVILFNESAERLFGYDSAEVIGKPFDMLMPERLRAGCRDWIEALGAARDAGQSTEGRDRTIGLHKDSAEFPTVASISRYPSGLDSIYTVMFQDAGAR